jgi:5-methylcytosine-specific restriction endonuclease McrA
MGLSGQPQGPILRSGVDVCALPGCHARLRPTNTKGYCQKHSHVAKRSDAIATCVVDGCDKTVRLLANRNGGYCRDHRKDSSAMVEYQATYRLNNGEWRRADQRVRGAARRSAARLQRRVCLANGCEFRLWASNGLGYCFEHHNQSDTFKSMTAFHRRKREVAERDNPSERVYRRDVFERDGGVCHLCDKPVDPAGWALDHVIPISWGGPHCLDNVAVSHPVCNSRKRHFFTTPDPERLARATAAYDRLHGIGIHA